METDGRQASELTRRRTGLYQEHGFLKQQGIYFLNAAFAEESLFESGLLTQQKQSVRGDTTAAKSRGVSPLTHRRVLPLLQLCLCSCVEDRSSH